MVKSENPRTPSIRPSLKNHQENDSEADMNSYSLEKFKLYETRSKFYLIGSDRNKKFFRVLKIDRLEPSDLTINEDPVVYSLPEVRRMLQRMKEGNRPTGGLSYVAKFYGIAGCIKFLESYYLILVTKRRQVGCICGHAIYGIDETQLITIADVSVQTDVAHSKNELRYKKLLSSVDLTTDFFYSYRYPIMQTLQKNVLSLGEEGIPYANIFVWNAYLTQAIRSKLNNTIWTIALVHGHFKQTRLSIFGKDFSVALISRRSRHFAGTRYLKRGVNDRGKVANDVETEQIIIDEEVGSCKGKMSSVVQMRGSIPLFWSQEASRFSPKPDINLQRYDPTYEATKLHFDDMAKRYGNPIIVLNLIKTVEKRPREMMLRREFANAVGYLNQILPEENHLKFIHWDFHKFAKSKSANVLAVLGGVASEALDLTGFYYSGKAVAKRKANHLSQSRIRRQQKSNSVDHGWNRSACETTNAVVFQSRESIASEQATKDLYGGATPCFQSGVLRTNCIDCLDRTNVAQYAYGLAALGHQLHAMGLTDMPKVHSESSIAAALMDMYQSMGDALAQQYGGSAAHNTVFLERQGKWKATTQSREFLKSIKRYYSNTCTDGEKQDAINLFLGYFKPQEGKPALWELDSDYYLHVSGIGDDFFPDPCSNGDTMAVGKEGTILAPIPACRDDFSRMKFTSFDKFIERTCTSLKNVRLFCEPSQKPGGGNGDFGMAPDAAEIQLKSPNWLFGQRKYEGSVSVPKMASNTNASDEPQGGDLNGFYDLNWLSTLGSTNEEDIFNRYISMTYVDEANGWYGGTLLGDQDESSEIYQHYAQLCEGSTMEPFESDAEKELDYANVVNLSSMNGTDGVVAAMETAMQEFDHIGDDLGRVSKICKVLGDDSSRLTRWIIGEDKLQIS